jgi:DNA replication protein DnaC
MSQPRAAPCEICGDTGWQPVGGLTDRVVRCVCWLEKQRAWADGVPQEFQAATLANYRPLAGNREALRVAGTFAEGSRDLVLIGPVGSGKTRLACSVLNALYAATKQGYFVRVPWMLHQLQPAPDPDGAAAVRARERRLTDEPIVCFDDLGAERDRATDYTRRTLLMLYERRHDQGLRTIWTSNKGIDDLSAMQDDDRLASRLAGWSDVVELTCADQRVSGH